MNQIPEDLIERFVRNPHRLDASTRRAVEKMIEENPVAAEIARFYAEFYRDLTQQSPGWPSLNGTRGKDQSDS